MSIKVIKHLLVIAFTNFFYLLVYVKYDDITAEDFLFVQTNINYRREWDNTAVKLDIVDSDPEDDQDVIYWEMLWPRLFANRDYVSLYHLKKFL